METGCALIALIIMIGVVWFFAHLLSSAAARRRDVEQRLQGLESEVLRLQQALDGQQRGTATQGAASASSESASPELDRRAADAGALFTPAPTDQPSEEPRSGEPMELQLGSAADSAMELPVGDPVDGPLSDGGEARIEAVAARSLTEPASPKLAERKSDSSDDASASLREDDATPSNTDEDPDHAGSDGDASTPVPPGPPPHSKPTIDWEQWVGVRGLAVLAGIVLAVAGIYFVRFSIERGLIPPTVRVALLLLAGVASIGFGGRFRNSGHIFPANALQGAGIVMCYAAVWAARNLYDLIGSGAAFALLALITAAGGTLSVRHQSLVIALLGLLGGFATPLLVASESANAVGLFGYLLLLNAGVALVGRKGQWPILSALSLVATVLYQAAWIFEAAEGRVVLGLAILGVFALFFLWNINRGFGDEQDDDSLRASRGYQLSMTIGALFSPFVFAVYFAANSDIGDQLLPFGGLLLLLNLAAAWIARRQRLPELALGTVAATLGVFATWPVSQEFSSSSLLETLIGSLALLAVHQIASLVLGSSDGATVLRNRWQVPELVAASVAAFAIPLLHAIEWWERGPSPWFTLGIVLVAVVLLYQALRFDQTARSPSATKTRSLAWLPAGVAATSLGAHVFATVVAQIGEDATGLFGPPWLLLGALVVALGLQVFSINRQQRLLAVEATNGYGVEWALALFPLLVLGTLWFDHIGGSAHTPVVQTALGAIAMGGLLLLSATRILSGKLTVVSLVGTSIVFAALAIVGFDPGGLALVCTAAAILLFLLWPSFVPRGQAEIGTSPAALTDDVPARRWPLSAVRAAALAPVAFAAPFVTFYERTFGDGFPAVAMLALGAAALLGLRLATPRSTTSSLASVQAWFGAVALGFVAIAIPVQVDREWITVGWALLALAVSALWVRVDHAGLKLFALGLAVVVAIRLLLNTEVLLYHEPRAPFGLPVVGWLLYTYLLPAAALLGIHRLLEPREGRRLRSWEPFAHLEASWVANTCGFLAIALVFAWINLTIFDAFATGDRLQLALHRAPARDLTLSFAWGLFALLLLIVGVARVSKSLRWGSLLIIFATIAKVFLYDLGELEDLYRVASLVGLAFSLLAVSVLYQRFVFSGDRQSADSEDVAADENEPTASEQDPSP